MEAIDGLTDPYAAALWLEQQIIERNGFYRKGRFFIAFGTYYAEFTSKELQNVIFDLLKSKGSDQKAKYITDHLARKLENNEENFEVIPFENGYLDKSGLFIGSKDYRIELKQTDIIPHYYDLLGIPEKWLNFLDDVFDGDDDKDQKIAVIQEWFGYCMDRSLNLHKALVLYGDGGNGKSVILDVLAAIFPHVTRLEWHELNEQRNLERLVGSWVNIATEISYKDNTGTTGFKKAIAGETMTANPKYKQPFDFTPYAKFAFATNGLPMVDDISNGVFRRLMVINLNNSFVGREDWALTAKLREEIPGILAWANIGLQRLKKNRKFTEVPSNIIELAEYRRAINSLQSFYDEELEMYEGQTLSFSEFYRKYTSYCHETSNRPFARNKIRSVVNQLGLKLSVYTGADNIRMVKALAPINADRKPF
jgi:P4 family phage/plasmid primase-like protien